MKKKMKKNKKIYDVRAINRMRCVSGIVMGSLIIAAALFALVLNVANYYLDDVPEAGLGTFRMFTTLSNLLVAVAAFLIISYQIDGLRKDNYHLPQWVVDLLYVGTVGVAVTFLVAATAISAAQGFGVAMFGKSNVFMHTAIPVMAVVLFTFVNSDHNVRFAKTFLSLSPLFVYAAVYFVMAIAIGEERGGWRDVYGLNAFIPWPVTYLGMFLLSFGISTLLRVLHNARHARRKRAIRDYYLYSDDFSGLSIEEAVAKLAKNPIPQPAYIDVPLRIIEMLRERYGCEESTADLAKIYVDACLCRKFCDS
ncbi:MAG: hypothetical protein J6V01_07390 [Clostridia bacterium]|nr:hypothetical protein [Clostridia bacterium]